MQDNYIEDRERNIRVNKVLTNLIVKKDYQKLMDNVNNVEQRANDSARLSNLLNLQDDSGKTLIHHIVENPRGGYREGIWALIELHIKGANVNLVNNLGNTALHSCLHMYKGYMDEHAASETEGGFTMFASEINGELVPVNVGYGPPGERIMFACMADVGALLWCGADPKIKNKEGLEVFGMMASAAKLMKDDCAKPNIREASCKKAFLEFFDHKKQYMCPWAPNVINWVKSLKIDDEVKNASLARLAPNTQKPSNCLMM